MVKIKCRTCLGITDRKKSTKITRPCYSEKTVWDAIVLLVPEMVSTLSSDELICENCLNILRSSIKFIKRCSEVEMIYARNRNQFKYTECLDDLSNIDTENNEVDKNAENEKQIEDTDYVEDLFEESPENKEVEDEVENKKYFEAESSDDANDSLENSTKNNEIEDEEKEQLENIGYVGDLLQNENSEYNAESITFTEDNHQIQMDHSYCVKSEPDEQSYIQYEPEHSTDFTSSENVTETENYSIYYCSESMVNSPVVSCQNLDECDDSFNQYGNSVPDEVVLKSFVTSSQNTETGNDNLDLPIQIVFEDSIIKDEESDSNVELKSETMSDDEISEDFQSEEYNENCDRNCFTCANCSQTFSSKDEYNIHLEIHPSFVCHLCGRRLKNGASYRHHMKIHNDKTVCMCEYCGKVFKCTSALTYHISVHKEERSYMCDQCPKTFKNKFKLRNHIKVVHEKLGRQQCQGCGKLFQNKEACENHYRLIHLQLKPYACDICGLGFGRKDYLKKHMYRHTGEPRQYNNKEGKRRRPKFGIRLRDPGKPVSCKICGKQITTVHLLKAHLQTHVRIKRFRCKLCELTFTLAANRDRHEKLHETDPENKFRCNICWKRVKTEEELEKHILNHCNRPPQHSCDLCGEKFHRKYLLDNHLLDKHTGPGDIERAEEEIVMKNLLEYADQ